MQEIGRVLKEKRTELGLSLLDIEQRTKIRNRYLEAIEDGDWSVMPGDVYARGFIRAYADAIGIDGNELLRSIPDKAPVQQPDEPQPSVQTPTEKPVSRSVPVRAQTSSKPPRRTSRFAQATPRTGFHAGQIAFVVVILVLLGVGWWLLTRSGHHDAPGGKPGGQAAANNTTAPSQNQSQAGSNSTGTIPNNTAANNTTVPATPTVQITSSPQSNGDVTYAVTSNPAQPLSASLATGSAQCWVQLTIDGVNQGAGGVMLQPNSKKTWHAKNSMVIRVGNLPDMQLTIDGKSVTLPKVNHPINVTISNH